MNDNQAPLIAGTVDATQKKKPYEGPVLRVFGTLGALTNTGGRTGTDKKSKRP